MKSGEIMIVADTKIYFLDEIFNACLIQENSLVKMLNILLEKRQRRIDPEIRHTEFNTDLGTHNCIHFPLKHIDT